MKPRRHDHRVAGMYLEEAVLARGDAGQGGQGFSLGARDQQHHLLVGQAGQVVGPAGHAWGDVHEALLQGTARCWWDRVLPLTATLRPKRAARSYTSWIRWMWLENRVRMMRPLGLGENVMEGGHDLPFREGYSVPLHVGGVGEQEQGRPRWRRRRMLSRSVACPPRGVGINLEVAGVQEPAPRAFRCPGRSLR